MADPEEFRKWLEAHGFKCAPNSTASEMNECRWYAWRRSAMWARRCECNDDKEGVQVVITPYQFTIGGDKHQGVEVEVCGQYGGAWYRLTAYSISMEELPQKLPQAEKALVHAWNALEEANYD